MAIPTDYKDTMDYQMIGGLDEDGEAQELTFDGDKVKISTGSDALIISLTNYMRQSTELQEEIIHQLKITNAILTMVTEIDINQEET